MKTSAVKIPSLLTIAFLLSVLTVMSETGNDEAAHSEQNLGATTVTLANGEWAPFFSENLKYYGVVSRIVNDAFAQEGVKVKFVFRPWMRGLQEAAKGKWNGTVGWLKTEDRLKQFYFSEPIMKPTPIFFQRKDKPIKWKTMSDLQGIKIGTTTGYYYGKEFAEAEAEKKISVIRSVEPILNLKMLIGMRIDLAAVEREVGLNLLKTRFTPGESAQIEPQDKIFHSDDAYLLLSKKWKNSRQLVEKFNRGLNKLAIEGIVSRYWWESRKGLYIQKRTKEQ
jgi:polar amino acid transport system substrate-binding protein